MQALLVPRCLLEALKGSEKMGDVLTAKEKTTMIQKAHYTIVLSLGDKVLWQVLKEKIAAGVWTKIEGLYMTKLLFNRL